LNLQSCRNIADLRKRAHAKLPAPMFHYIDGGADDEVSLRRSTDAFDDYELLPQYLQNIEDVDLSTRILGANLDMPFFLSPTGMSRLFHHDRELGAARAAEKFGTFYSLSTVGTASIEEVAKTVACPKMFQIYVLRDRELTREFVTRCKEAGFQALCLTVDTPVAGHRDRDFVHGLSIPPNFRLKSLWSFVAHPSWTLNLLRHRDFRITNVVHRVDALAKGAMSLIQYVNSQFDPTINWKDAEWIINEWGGPFAIKGLLTPEDARRAVDVGASAIMISNHGGRQLDTVPAPIDCVAPMRDAVGDSIELILDGGIRRGTHILKALALGADACSFGRPYLYGLAAGGQAGVERALYLLRQELVRNMSLIGCRTLQDVTRVRVRARRQFG